MEILYYGHSALGLKGDGYELCFDPFLKDNPLFDQSLWNSIQPDYILVSHGHGDHLGDTIELARKKNGTVIAVYELAKYLEKKGIQTKDMHIGGGTQTPFGKVKLTPAAHGSALMNEEGKWEYMGNPCGFLVWFEGKLFYFAGDTGLFYDMKLIGEMYEMDYAFLPIGDNYTMGIDDALKALELLKPKKAVPIHYNTFPAIQADPEVFKERASDLDTEVIILKPNQSIII